MNERKRVYSDEQIEEIIEGVSDEVAERLIEEIENLQPTEGSDCATIIEFLKGLLICSLFVVAGGLYVAINYTNLLPNISTDFEGLNSVLIGTLIVTAISFFYRRHEL